MKKFRNLLIIALVSTSLHSCEIGFLDNKALSDITSENFYKSLPDYEKALVGCYYYISGRGDRKEGNYTFGVPIISEAGSDEIFVNPTKGANFESAMQLDSYNTLNASNQICEAIWQNHYQGIAGTNQILSRIDRMSSEDLDATPRFREIAAEARFLQALWYFNLARIFGGVPLMTEMKEGDYDYSKEKRKPLKDVYLHILSLLEYSKEHLPAEIREYGRARKISAYALSSKVNLQIASSMNLLNPSLKNESVKLNNINDFEWTISNENGTELSFAETIKYYYSAAKTDADFVLTDYSNKHGGRYLESKYEDCFYPNESSDEILFEAIMSTGLSQEMGGWFGSLFGPFGQSQAGGGQQVLMSNNPVILDTYAFNCTGSSPSNVNYAETADQRFMWAISTVSRQKGKPETKIALASSYKQFQIGKFRIDADPSYNQDRAPVNNPILRVADICLIYAEAQAELDDLNAPGSPVSDESFKFINIVRERAGLNSFLYDNKSIVKNISYNNHTQTGNKEIKGYTETYTYAGGSPIGHFRRAILNERMLELCGEGHRWYDLVRMGMLINTVRATTDYSSSPGTVKINNVTVKRDNGKLFPIRVIDEYNIFRPIPSREISIHKGNLLQNFGYL